ncbi:MAG: hypothetical protein ACKO9H_14665, partial [Planctomycetota bacterium]
DLVNELLDWLLAVSRIQQTQTAKFRPVIDITAGGREWLRGEFSGSIASRMPANRVSGLESACKGQTPKGVSSTAKAIPTPPQAEDSPTENLPDGEQARVERLLDSVPVIAPTQKSKPLSEPSIEPAIIQPRSSRQTRIDLPHQTARQPAWFWTWRLLADGYAWNQICAVRNLDCVTVLEHLTIAAREKKPVDLTVFFGELREDQGIQRKEFVRQAALGTGEQQTRLEELLDLLLQLTN